ncbi:MAG: hypothetical protein NDP09_06800 [Crenarchaeota archaeon]|nr:hypothetical protein [Thermoproteota archaeon]
MLLPPVYDISKLAALRSSRQAYIHPYTPEGTSPSLIGQLQYYRLTMAYNIPLLRGILGHKGIYIRAVSELVEIIFKSN